MAKKSIQKPVVKAPVINNRPEIKKTSVVEKSNGVKFDYLKYFTLPVKMCILLGVIAFCVYYNTLQNGYVLDDVMVVKDNTMVRKGISAIPDLLSTPHLRGYLKLGNDTYRPLSLVFFAAIFHFVGDNTTIFHLFNILIFTGCVVFFFLFLNKLFYGTRTALAFMATLFFAVHPIHTEVVANIKSLDELLCFFFAFLSLNFFANYVNKAKKLQLVLGAVSLYLSYISKETVIAFLFVIPLIFFFYLNHNKQRSIIVVSISTFVAGIFLFIRWAILTKYVANVHSNINFVDNFLVRSPTPLSRLATEILILGKYFLLHLKPYPLISDYSYRSIPYVYFTDILVWVSLILYIGIIVVSIFRLLKVKRDPLAFGILFYLSTLVLFSNIPFYIGSALAERFAFYCSAGFCIILAFAIEKWIAKSQDFEIVKSQKILFTIVPITLIFGYLTIDRNSNWRSDYDLYKVDIVRSPDNTRLGYDMANEMEKVYEKEADPVKKKELIKQSMGYLRKSLEIYPYNTDSHLELGVDFFNQQMYDSAEKYFKRAIELNPRQSNAMYNLATIYLRLNRFAEAKVYYQKTVEVNPDRFPAIFNEGVCYYQIQKYDSAIIDFKKTIQLKPDYYNYKSFGYTAIVYKTIGNMDSAKRYEALAKQYDPTFKM